MTSNMDEVLKDAYVELAPYLEEHVIAKVDFFQKSPDRLCRMRWSFIVLMRMFASLRTMCVAVYVLVCVCQCVLCDRVEYDKADFWESLPVCGSCVRKSVEPCVCAIVVLLNAPSGTVAIVFRISAVVFRISAVVFRISAVVFRISAVVFRISAVVFRISATVSRIWAETSLLKIKLLSKTFLSLYSWACGTLCCAFVNCLCVIVYHVNCVCHSDCVSCWLCFILMLRHILLVLLSESSDLRSICACVVCVCVTVCHISDSVLSKTAIFAKKEGRKREIFNESARGSSLREANV